MIKFEQWDDEMPETTAPTWCLSLKGFNETLKNFFSKLKSLKFLNVEIQNVKGQKWFQI